MRLVLQRVKSASVTVNNQQISSIGNGVLALVGLHQNDSAEDLAYCAKKLLGCKLWANDEGKAWRKSVKQMEYDVLLVSQFTLLGTIANKKHSPDFKLSMKPDEARAQYEAFKSLVSAGHDASRVYDGEFGAMMDVDSITLGSWRERAVALAFDFKSKCLPGSGTTNTTRATKHKQKGKC